MRGARAGSSSCNSSQRLLDGAEVYKVKSRLYNADSGQRLLDGDEVVSGAARCAEQIDCILYNVHSIYSIK